MVNKNPKTWLLLNNIKFTYITNTHLLISGKRFCRTLYACRGSQHRANKATTIANIFITWNRKSTSKYVYYVSYQLILVKYKFIQLHSLSHPPSFPKKRCLGKYVCAKRKKKHVTAYCLNSQSYCFINNETTLFRLRISLSCK